MNKPLTDEDRDTAPDVGSCFRVEPRAGTSFGARVYFEQGLDFVEVIERLERDAGALVGALHAANGLLVMPATDAFRDDPQLLVRLSRLFGDEVENYLETQMATNKVHASVPEILVVSNMPPVRRQPPPRPPCNPDDSLAVQFPQRRG